MDQKLNSVGSQFLLRPAFMYAIQARDCVEISDTTCFNIFAIRDRI